jgi:hypothetical protein
MTTEYPKRPLLCCDDGLRMVDIPPGANLVITSVDGRQVHCELMTFVYHSEVENGSELLVDTCMCQAFVEHGLPAQDAFRLLVKHDDLWDRIPKAMTHREARLLALLREVEWDGRSCAICYQPQSAGHTPDCKLAAELAAGPSPMAADRLPSGTEGEG